MGEEKFEGDPEEEINQVLQNQLKPGECRVVNDLEGVGYFLIGNDYNASGAIVGTHTKHFNNAVELAVELGMDAKLIHDGLVVTKPKAEEVSKPANNFERAA